MTPDHVHQPRNEWLKFGILAVILIGTILVIALLRPWIFGHVVPAVIGTGLDPVPQSTEAVETTDESATEEVDHETEANPEETIEEEAAGEEESASEEASSSETENTSTEENEADTDASSDEADSEEIIHTVQQGENLLAIAREYGVTRDAIVAANNLRNPNYIRAGEQLIIPQADDE